MVIAIPAKIPAVNSVAIAPHQFQMDDGVYSHLG
jgi:hypothetical protein